MKMRDEREARARFLLGRLLAESYRDECAAELLRDAISYAPGMAEAHVELGVVYCRLESYDEMLASFREAIRIDERAVRAAVRKDPVELEAIRRVLYPERPTPTPKPSDEPHVSRAPGYVRQTWALMDLAREHIGAGRDEQAIAALEAALRIDRTYQYMAALLALTHLLIREGGATAPTELTEGEGSALWEAEPELAALLFRRQGETPTVSH